MNLVYVVQGEHVLCTVAVMKYVLLSLMDMKRCGSYFCMGLGKEVYAAGFMYEFW